jgi:hypothetical protein
MSLILIDLIVALATALALSWLLTRFVHLHGPWRAPWAFPLMIFLFAWAGGVSTASLASGWLLYAMPFVVAGLVAAMLIVATSPRHDLETQEDSEAFHREEEAVVTSVVVFFWAVIAILVAVVVAAYLD